MRIAFDGRSRGKTDGIGHYSRCLLAALRETAGEHDEILETHRPRGAQVFHAPRIEGAMLHSPCPMVVTVHDVRPLIRRSERLRCGGVHLRLRHLALQRATHVIVPNYEVAGEAVAEFALDRERVVVIPQAADAHAADAKAANAKAADTSLWTWQDAAHATWRLYAEALARPNLSMRLAVRAPRARS
jgi:hypothetical protein